MLKLQTQIDITPSNTPIDLQTPIVLLGSCFAQHIQAKLQDYKFRVGEAATGVIFNPISISSLVKWSFGKENWADLERVTAKDGLFRHFNLHSYFYGQSQNELFEKMQGLQSAFRKELEACRFLVITLGTAWVYEHLSTQQVVANCHKVPATEFKKRMLSLPEITSSLQEIKALLPNTRILLTVSPVRHIKDTIPLNMASKSALRLACHQLQEDAGFEYFPSYEIMMDELRDYRFYEPDLIHPSQQAINYIWERFTEAYFDQETQRWLTTWEKIRKSVQHRPLVSCTESHIRFLQGLKKKLRSIPSVIDVREEIEQVEQAISACQPLS